MERVRCSGLLGCAVVVLALTAASALAGEHREILAELKAGTPAWYQPDMKAGYPAGCGPAAWAIVYAYWAQHHGAAGLFPGYTIDASSNGSQDPPVLSAMERLGSLVKTEYVQMSGPSRDRRDDTQVSEHGGRYQLGSTRHLEMCDAIAYARERGFPHSRCFRIMGSEFDKFEHVKRHLEADRPVILAISTKGHKSVNHYVVVEKARKIQEKAAGQWRDRDVEYSVNYGWGGDRQAMPEWLSARQVGVNTSQVYTVTSAFLVNVSATPLSMATDANQEACGEWCDSPAGRAAGCKTCSKLAGCGPGYKHLESFRGADTDWHACAPRDTDRAQASEGHREACEQWCRDNPQCKNCSTQAGCGPGYRAIKSWTGYGNNWHACAEQGPSRREEAGDQHQQACEEWCRSHSECIKCSKNVGCGVGFESLESWRGYGQNWYACGHTARQDAGDRHKADCESWCRANPDCGMCSTLAGCGQGYTALKSWTGYGRNWHACGKRESREEASQGNEQECRDWCAGHSNCAKCSTNPGCGVGYKRIEAFGGRGQNWYACQKR